MSHGIENLKSALAVAINLAEAIEKRLDDGKISLVEGITLVPKIKDIPGVIKNAKLIKAEFMDLDEFEQQEIKQFIKDGLSLENEKAEQIVEASLDVLTSLASLIAAIRGDDDEPEVEPSSPGGGGPGDPPPPPTGGD